MKKIFLVLFLAFLFSLDSFGYATIFQEVWKDGGDKITFNSNVNEVTVYIDSRPIGIIRGGALEYTLARDGKNKFVQFKKPGYKDEEIFIGTKLALTFWGNVGFLYFGTTGSSTDSWSTKNSRQYTPNQFYVEMEKI